MAFDYIGALDSASALSTYTFNGASLGDADSTRLVVLAITSRNNSFANGAANITACTIGGVNATVIHAEHQSSGSPAGFHAYIVTAEVPSGTTGDISITFSQAQLWCHIGVYRAVDLVSNTPTFQGGTSGPQFTGDTTIGFSNFLDLDNGIILVVSAFSSNVGTPSFPAGIQTTDFNAITPVAGGNDWTLSGHSTGLNTDTLVQIRQTVTDVLAAAGVSWNEADTPLDATIEQHLAPVVQAAEAELGTISAAIGQDLQPVTSAASAQQAINIAIGQRLAPVVQAALAGLPQVASIGQTLRPVQSSAYGFPRIDGFYSVRSAFSSSDHPRLAEFVFDAINPAAGRENTLVVAFVMIHNTDFNGAVSDVLAATYGGQAMTVSPAEPTSIYGLERFKMYTLLDPPTGTNPFRFTFTTTANQSVAVLVAFVDDVDQNNPIGDAQVFFMPEQDTDPTPIRFEMQTRRENSRLLMAALEPFGPYYGPHEPDAGTFEIIDGTTAPITGPNQIGEMTFFAGVRLAGAIGIYEIGGQPDEPEIGRFAIAIEILRHITGPDIPEPTPEEPTVIEVPGTDPVSLLIQQYREKPNIVGFIRAFAKELDALRQTGQDLLLKRALETAEGAQLDIIGKIVNFRRPSVDVDPTEVFTFASDESDGGLGFSGIGNENYGGYFIGLESVGNTLVDDFAYRRFLKAAIIRNTTVATIPDMIRWAAFVFGAGLHISTAGTGFVDIVIFRKLSIREQRFVRDTFPLAAGIRIGTAGYGSGPNPFGFAGGDVNTGFGGLLQPSTGSGFIGLFQV